MNPEIDTDYNGNALDLSVDGGAVVSMRRHGNRVAFALVGAGVLALTPEECDKIATALASAAVLARREDGRERSPDPPPFDLYDCGARPECADGCVGRAQRFQCIKLNTGVVTTVRLPADPGRSLTEDAP